LLYARRGHRETVVGRPAAWVEVARRLYARAELISTSVLTVRQFLVVAGARTTRSK
jgi:hypothetical protein